MPVNEDAALIAERSALYETLKALSADDWDQASLCPAWRVRDVAAHVQLLATMSPFRLIGGVIVNRGDFNRFMAKYAPKVGSRPTADLLAAFAIAAQSARIPPSTKKVELAFDCFVHHHDICIPLGRDVPSDPERLRWMADGMVAAKSAIGSGSRVDGLRLIATDIDWHYGTGPEVQGPAAALILAGCGRTALHDQLSGAGLAEFERRP